MTLRSAEADEVSNAVERAADELLAYNRHLCKLIHQGRARPSFIVSHELPLDEAPQAYERLDARESGWTKVVLKPQMAKSAHRGPGAGPKTHSTHKHAASGHQH